MDLLKETRFHSKAPYNPQTVVPVEEEPLADRLNNGPERKPEDLHRQVSVSLLGQSRSWIFLVPSVSLGAGQPHL